MSTVRRASNLSVVAHGVLMLCLGMALFSLISFMTTPKLQAQGYRLAVLLTAVCLLAPGLAAFIGAMTKSAWRSYRHFISALAAGFSIAFWLSFWLNQSDPFGIDLLVFLAGLHGIFWGIWYLGLAQSLRTYPLKAGVVCLLGAATSAIGIVIAAESTMSEIGAVTAVASYATFVGIEILITALYLFRNWEMNAAVKLPPLRNLVGMGLFLAVLASAPRAEAIPAFARKYHTACATCHNNWPELNDFGLAFKLNGFKFPKDDEDFVKEPPLMLGAEAQKEVFPHSIYPGELPILPISFRYSGYFSYNTPQPAAVVAADGFVPQTDLFAPNTFTIIAASSLGPSLEFWIDDDLATGGSGAYGGLGDAYIKANDAIGHYLHVPRNDLNVRYGQFEIDLPFTQARTINLSDYAIYDETANVNPTGKGPLAGTTANPFTFSAPQRGIELGGYPHQGYTWWSVGVLDGENSLYGNSAPLAARNSKDIYVNFWQSFNLERDPAIRKQIQASGATGVHDHTWIRFNGFGYFGTNQLNQGGTLYAGLPLIHEPFYRAGGAFDYRFRSDFELWGLYEHGHDDNEALNGEGTGFVPATPVTFSGGFLEAEYWFYPWLIGLMRYDGVNSPTDRLNGLSRRDTRNIYSPGLQILVRPNIKLEMQYSYSYEQPVPGASTFYRDNNFKSGIDFAF